MFPEAGGSSSFARHAFNEIASFFAGWALTLDYIITIAISAFFVPHYVGAFFPALRHNPGDIIGGFVVVVVLAALNIRGLRESATLNIFLAITDLLTQIALIVLGAALIFDPSVLGIVSWLPLGWGLKHALRYYVGGRGATILIIATNAGLIGISRLSWSLAEPRQLPAVFAWVHRRYRTPWFTIVVFSFLAALLLIPGKTTFLGNLYSFGAMLSFTTAHIAVIALRYKDPDRHRPYRVPWNIRFRGGWLPLSAVLGGIGTFAAWLSVVILKPEARLVGIPWMVLGLGGYFLYRPPIGVDPRVEGPIERPS